MRSDFKGVRAALTVLQGSWSAGFFKLVMEITSGLDSHWNIQSASGPLLLSLTYIIPFNPVRWGAQDPFNSQGNGGLEDLSSSSVVDMHSKL